MRVKEEKRFRRTVRCNQYFWFSCGHKLLQRILQNHFYQREVLTPQRLREIDINNRNRAPRFLLIAHLLGKVHNLILSDIHKDLIASRRGRHRANGIKSAEISRGFCFALLFPILGPHCLKFCHVTEHQCEYLLGH